MVSCNLETSKTKYKHCFRGPAPLNNIIKKLFLIIAYNRDPLVGCMVLFVSDGMTWIDLMLISINIILIEINGLVWLLSSLRTTW